MSKVQRETRETNITLEVKIGSGKVEASTGEPFLDHMLITLGRYAGLDLTISATGDMRHHLIEDVAITLGLALSQEVPAQAERYGWALVPMDEALAQAAVDVGGRSFYSGKIPSPLYEHFLHSFAINLGATIHVRILRGTDRHHMVEAAVKAVGLALRQALRTGDQVFSTKGAVALSAPKESAPKKSAKSPAKGPVKGATKGGMKDRLKGGVNGVKGAAMAVKDAVETAAKGAQEATKGAVKGAKRGAKMGAVKGAVSGAVKGASKGASKGAAKARASAKKGKSTPKAER